MSISLVIIHQINSYPDFTVRALFSNLLTGNVLNLCHSLANNLPLLFNHQRLIYSNKRKFKYLSPIGYLPIFTLIDAILEVLPYKLTISKFMPVSSSLFLCPLTHPLSNSYQPNHTLFQNNK